MKQVNNTKINNFLLLILKPLANKIWKMILCQSRHCFDYSSSATEKLYLLFLRGNQFAYYFAHLYQG